jgi:hypothetical protein
MIFVITVGLVGIAIALLFLFQSWAERDTAQFIAYSKPYAFLTVLFISVAMYLMVWFAYNQGHDNGKAAYFTPQQCTDYGD